MATPSEIAAGATCYACVPNKMDALLYLFATIAGVADPATIAANAACYACIPNKEDALLYLADLIATNGTGGGGGGAAAGCMPTTAGNPEGVLVSTCTPSLAVDPATSAIYLFTGVAGTSVGWALKV